MDKRIVFILMIFFFVPQIVKGIDITDCTDITSSGTYTLTQDITPYSSNFKSSCINIQANNVVLDCQWHKIQGTSYTSYGIYIFRSSNQVTNITIKNCNVTDWDEANIYLERANNNTLENIISLDSPDRGIYLRYSHNSTLTNITANSNNYGFYLYSSDSNTITNSTANNNSRGFYFSYSDSNTIIDSTAKDNENYGFYLYSSDSNTITNSTANSNNRGFYLYSSDSNTLTNSTANNNDYGLYIYANSDNNVINNSIFQNNSEAGLYLSSSGSNYPDYNHIYNCLFNNSGTNGNIYINVGTHTNYWNTTKQEGERIYSAGNYIGGNYYTNSTGNGFSDTCEDSDHDGFCDQVYDVYNDTWCEPGVNCSSQVDYLPLSDEYQSCTPITDCTDIIQPGNYCLTQDITPSSSNFKSYCINISANNVTLNCQWHKIQGDDNKDYGIYIYRSSNQVTNITIKNCNVTDWSTANIYLYNANNNTLENIISLSSPDNGIDLHYSHNNTIINSTTNSNSYYGLYLSSSNSNTITNCTANSNNDGFHISYSYSNTISNSTAKENSIWDLSISTSYPSQCNNYIGNLTGSGDRPIKYFKSSVTLHDEILSELVLCNADYSNITNITIDASPTKKNNGIFIRFTDHSNFTYINSSFNLYGFRFSSSSYNSVINSFVNSNNDDGIFIYGESGFPSNYNTLTNITANYNNDDGISISGSYSHFSNSNTLTNITANYNNDDGIYIRNSNSNTLTNITANYNNGSGIHFYDSSNSNTLTNITANYNNEDGLWFDNENSYNTISYATIYSNYDNGIQTEIGSDSNTFVNITIGYNSGDGIYSYHSKNNVFTNITAIGNVCGIRLFGESDNNNITNSVFIDNSNSGIYFNVIHTNYPEYNHIYNCLFNNSKNIRIDPGIPNPNYFNTTKQLGTRIYSPGNYIGGNYYTNSAGNGFSDTCEDSDHDGFCDKVYDVYNDTWCEPSINCSNQVDYLPLSDEYANTISDCIDITQPGTYYLIQDINESSPNFKSKCINIQANNVVLDCQWHEIQGDGDKDYGIYVYRSSNQVTNITIKNCNVTDWNDASIYLYNANSNTLTNITANSNSWNGIFLESSNSNTLTNITANNNTYNGILLFSSNSNTITNSTANNNGGDGFYLSYSNFNTITNITANNNEEDGLYLESSNSNTITNSTLSENSQYDFCIYVDSDSECNNYLSNVTGSGGRPIEYYNYSVNIHDKTLPELILCNADNSNVTNVTIEGSPTKKNNALFLIRTNGTNLTNINSSNNDCGIYLYSSNSNTLTNITANSNSWNGIFIRSSSNSNTLTNITANNNGENGIYLLYSNSNTISNTTANSNYWGIYLYSSNSNTLTNITANNNNYSLILDHSNSNTLTNSTVNNNNYYGLVIYYSDSNIVNNSVFQNNINYGIYLDSAGQSGPNKIYNCLLDNTNNVYFEGTVYSNYWNTTKQAGTRIYSSGNYIGGNYYTNSTGNGYSDTCTDSDADGFCDHPYDLYNDTWCEPGVNCSNQVDYLPLTFSGEAFSGKVLYWNNGTPIAGANVIIKIYDGTKFLVQGSDVTDSSGRYSIRIIYPFEENKRYLANITVTKDSYHSYLQHYFRL